ncbi:MAG: type IV pilin N-terminal domain-containing protein [Methanocorpusculum sp.]|nr:type IV pilin N-terminal domain-containing protein [Methanocorpusculum sp.]
MGKKQQANDAVSPVVGVMLMLVVTIIIAALVSSFAAGLADSQSTPPQLALKGTYSQSGGLVITHAGGDPVALTDVAFMTTPSELFGADANKFAWTIDKSIILNSKNEPILNVKSGFYNTSAFVSGDSLHVSRANCIDDNRVGTLPSPGVNENAQLKWGGNADKNTYFAAYAFMNADNVGKYFYLDIIDPAGSIISRAKVTITA